MGTLKERIIAIAHELNENHEEAREDEFSAVIGIADHNTGRMLVAGAGNDLVSLKILHDASVEIAKNMGLLEDDDEEAEITGNFN